MRPIAPLLLLAALAGLAAGCANVVSGGLSERCADTMLRAYPGADIEITKREAAATGINTIAAKVEGVRRDMPPDGPLRRDLAVECRYDGDILTGFRWTAGPTR
jgi:hypothetical protein